MSEQISIVIVALDHITLRWENGGIDPKIALALGIVMNFRAEQAQPELSKATADMMIHGIGCYKVSADSIQHVPFHEVRQ